MFLRLVSWWALAGLLACMIVSVPDVHAAALERPKTMIGTALQAGPVRANDDGSFSVDLEVRLQNVGLETLVDVQIFSDLAADLAPATVIAIENLRAQGALSLVSNTFDGGLDRYMLPGTERLESDDEALVSYTLRFSANGEAGPFRVRAMGWAEGETSGDEADDVSQDGIDPDPDTPGNAPGDNPDPHDDFDPTPLPLPTLPDPDPDPDPDPVFGALAGTVFFDPDLNSAQSSGEQGLADWRITVFSVAFELVAETTTDADGFYTVAALAPADYIVRIAHPESAATWLEERVRVPPDGTARLDLPVVSAGRIYDSVTRELVPGVTVQLVNVVTEQVLPPECLLPGQQPQTVGQDAAYRFDLLSGAAAACPAGVTSYRIDVLATPADYVAAPSLRIPPAAEALSLQACAPDGDLAPPCVVQANPLPPQGAQSSVYFLTLNAALADQTLANNHLPIDSVAGLSTPALIRLQKTAGSATVSAGDLVAYQITLQNDTVAQLSGVVLQDDLPAGFTLVDDSVRIRRAGSDGVLGTADDVEQALTASGVDVVDFEAIDLMAGEQVVVRYFARVGTGVVQGLYTNQVVAEQFGLPLSAAATAVVQVVADPLFDQSTIIGKVFDDRDGDGWQDPAEATGLVLSGGPFRAPVSLPDIRGRKAESDPPMRVQTALPGGFNAPISLRSAEGSFLTLGLDGEVRQSPEGDVVAGRTAQRLTMRILQDNGTPTLIVENTGIVERGIPGVRLATVDGLLIETDPYGRYHLADVATGTTGRGSNFIIKLDTATLPEGSTLVSENPRVIRLTPALMTRVDFAVGLPSPELVPAPSPTAYLEVATRTQRSEVRPVNFDTGKARLPDDYADQLRALLSEFRGKDNLQLTFVGHADPRSLRGALAKRFRDNVGLSEARAREVAEFARDVLDVDPQLVSFEGRGALQPIASNATAAGMALNRRVEIEVSWTETTERRLALSADNTPPPMGEQDNRYTQRTPLPSVRFASGSQALAPNAVAMVQRAIDRFGKNAVSLEVIGHTDNVPLGAENRARYGSNSALSLARAERVASELYKRFELPQSAISASGRGDKEPIASNNTAAGRAQNRRVDIVLITQEVERIARSWVAPLQASRTAYLPHGGRLWVTEQPLSITPKLNVLAQGDLLLDERRRAIASPRFDLFSNYDKFIGRKELRFYRSTDTDRRRVLAVIPIAPADKAVVAGALTDVAAPGLHAALTDRRTTSLRYVLRAYGAGETEDLFDETQPRTLLVRRADSARRQRVSQGESVWGLDNLVRQEIPVNGSQVRVHGVDIDTNFALSIAGESVPVNAEGNAIWERQLPVGTHRLQVDLEDTVGRRHARTLEVNVDGSYRFMMGLVNFAVGENSISGNLEPLSANDHFDESVFVDGRLAFYAKAKIKGKYLITAQLDSTEDELKNFGDNLRREDPRRLFRQLDPDRFYAVYGDDSTTTTDVDTQGAFYVRIDADESSAVWGNYLTGLNDTEFTQYNRSLYGAKLDYKSKRVTATGESRRRLSVFGSEAQSAAASVTFRATGGSLYYLRHTDIVQGSEKVWIEVRRRDSEQVLEREILLEGRDYEIDDLQGRVVLSRPLAQVVADRSPAIVRSSPLEGDDVFLLVDYEYVPPAFAAEDKTYGGRGKAWLGDHIAVGVSKVVDEREGTNYDLQGVDLTLQAGKGTYLRAEYAESEARQSQSAFVSADGGVSFLRRDRSPAAGFAQRDGEALALEGRLNLAEISDRLVGDVRAWWKDRDAGFSAGRLTEGLETNDMGVDAYIELNDRVRIGASYSSLDREGVGEDTVARAQVDANVGRMSAGLEVRYEDVEREAGISALSGQLGDGEALLLGGRFGFDVTEQTEVYVAGQITADEQGNYDDNDLISVGVNTELSSRSTVSVEVSDGDRGSAVIGGVQLGAGDGLQIDLSGGIGSGASSQFGTRYIYGDGAEIYGSYAIDPDRTEGPRDVVTLGQRRSCGDHTRIFSESQFGKGDIYSSTGHAFGVDYSGFQDWLLSASFQHSDNSGAFTAVQGDASLDGELSNFERTAVSLGARLERNRVRVGTRVEYREDNAVALHTRQYLASTTIGLQADERRRWLGRFNLSWTDDELGDVRQARFVEVDVGYAYRPVWSNRWNLLGKYSFLYDLPSEGQAVDDLGFFGLGSGFGPGQNRTDQRSHIFALEALFAANPKWEFGAKVALKRGEQRFGRDSGGWETFGVKLGALRARYHLARRWDGLLEYRWLSDWDNTGTRHGAIAALYRHLGNHLKLGAGYNFAGFDDDLKFHDYDSHGWFIDLIGKY